MTWGKVTQFPSSSTSCSAPALLAAIASLICSRASSAFAHSWAL
eukprot:CAMPEP_0182477602 /NCGR_PEP_ID=MMETSP1319-20130603/31132_1 /TAXON_ID=172717 /ORGANISM="Bolidomonas pacifica, Strain RCC208" /LENGTH=43 /DNA_ID= /DNA_START= /DNA_END= /DNA_ORIENTATION=